MKYFVVSFPYSSVGIAQVFPGENAECACEGLRRVFEFVGGVPRRIVFDNATGVGRRVCDKVRITELFGRFAVHYGFDFSFCNPASGNEKGNVENKVGYVRRELFVPVPRVDSIDSYNARPLDRCMALSGKRHWVKGEPEEQLFVEDRFALAGLPAAPFSAVRFERHRPDRVSVNALATGICNGRGVVDCASLVDMSDYDAVFAAVGGGRHDEQG